MKLTIGIILTLSILGGTLNVAGANPKTAEAGSLTAGRRDAALPATYRQPHGACAGPNAVILRKTGIEIRNERVAWLERCAEARWPTIGGLPMLDCIVQRESGGSPFALNPSGSAGLLQIIPSTFASWWQTFHARVVMQRLKHNVFNARTNLLLGVWVQQSTLSPWGGGC